MADLIALNRLMGKKIKLIEEDTLALEQLAINKAQTLSIYEKAVGLTIMQLKNGGSVEVDGVSITNPPATIAERIARAACWQECLEKEKAEALYKAAITRISSRSAQLNGYQSMNRYLSEADQEGG